jgi:hypothetical protein
MCEAKNKCSDQATNARDSTRPAALASRVGLDARQGWWKEHRSELLIVATPANV